ncbi:MAG: DUF3365 domain-containing protein [Leptospiraceae bacterium]|nr:DUF3365 domain-containing protein [Leptospiraceae bacterium]
MKYKLIFTIVLISSFVFCKEDSESRKKEFLKHGTSITLQAKSEIGKHLLNNIQSKGTIGALEFCNLNATPITYELTKKLNAKLKRVTDKPRNPENEVNQEEKIILEKFKTQLANNENLTPITIEKGTNQVGYFPIQTNKVCLQCHGVQDITPEVHSKLAALYPNDKAIGYGENQIRGMWVIEIEKENK